MKCIFVILLISFSVLHIGCSAANQADPANNATLRFAKKIVLQSIKRFNNTDSVEIKFLLDKSLPVAEAFRIKLNKNELNIASADAGGILYGSLKVRDELNRKGVFPEKYEFSDAPAMYWRGISLQLMKLGTYNYAITPQEFPFFYDKQLWLKFLNFMMNQKFNYIILWNGHPFDYFVKFDTYKEAQSGLNDEQIEKNNAMLKWLILEAKKRNIKIFFEFYNIHTSVYYQKAHNLPEEISVPTPELAAYTKYSISKFISEFPEVGLFVTPGEALQRQYSDSWTNDVIFKAVRETGLSPVIFMRAWFFDLEHARKIVNNYDNLHFVRKFNVEMIADKRSDPENSKWAKLNGNFIVNIHLSANLEPFRWSPPSYIQDIVKNNIESGANGIHLHPRKAWRWPYGSDIGVDLYQWQRDTLFFNAWSRYAWNPEREKNAEHEYWINLLSKRYGDKKAAQHFLNSFYSGADVLPALQRLIWLGYDNHTIVSAGATLLQLKNSKGIPFLSLDSTLRISEYIEALRKDKKITKETPIAFVEAKMEEAKKALEEAQKAMLSVKINLTEACRIVSDAKAVLYTTEFYLHKLKSIKAWVLLEAGKNQDQNRHIFIKELTASVNTFTNLAQLTSKTYSSTSDVYARHPLRMKKVPYHWNDLLPIYQKELEIYKSELAQKRSDNFNKPLFKGLAGIFYSEPDFMDAEESFYANKIDFNWDNDKEIGRNWSVKWFGFLHAPLSREIEIKFSADREAKLSIAGQALEIKNKDINSKTASWKIERGQFYPIEITYNHNGGVGGFINLQWSLDGQSWQHIPLSNLFHSEAQKSKITLLEKLIEVR